VAEAERVANDHRILLHDGLTHAHSAIEANGKDFMKKIQAFGEMNDIFLSDIPAWRTSKVQRATRVQSYAYPEDSFPVLEQTQLFQTLLSVEVTDIVEKEMYSFRRSNVKTF